MATIVIENYLKEGELGLIFTCDPYSKIIKSGDYNTELLFGDASSVSLVKKSKNIKLKHKPKKKKLIPISKQLNLSKRENPYMRLVNIEEWPLLQFKDTF